jgi:hypothetical protein
LLLLLGRHPISNKWLERDLGKKGLVSISREGIEESKRTYLLLR